MVEPPRPSNILILIAAAAQARDLASYAQADGEEARAAMLIANAEQHERAVEVLENSEAAPGAEMEGPP